MTNFFRKAFLVKIEDDAGETSFNIRLVSPDKKTIDKVNKAKRFSITVEEINWVDLRNLHQDSKLALDYIYGNMA